MAETDEAEQTARFQDKRMWRLLLAHLHPDAGGDHELFTFVCAVRKELLRVEQPTTFSEREEDAEREERSPVPFLRTWQDAMSRWSSSNDDTLRDFGTP